MATGATACAIAERQKFVTAAVAHIRAFSVPSGACDRATAWRAFNRMTRIEPGSYLHSSFAGCCTCSRRSKDPTAHTSNQLVRQTGVGAAESLCPRVCKRGKNHWDGLT